MLFWLLGCTILKPLPELGDCASYPEDGYDYGTIEIGSCLSGPTDLRFLEDNDGDWHLVMSNSNPYVNFADGSVLSIPWTNIDLDSPIHYSGTLNSQTLSLPSFAGKMALAEDGTALVTVRESEGSRTRTDEDFLYLVDLSDPSTLQFSNRGTNGSNTIEVGSDPVDIERDPVSNFAFVGNRISHDISIINTAESSMRIVAPWPYEVLGEARFIDSDNSGSTASLSSLEDLTSYYEEILEEEELDALVGLSDDSWSLEWIEGSWQMWLTDDTSGFQRFQSVDAMTFLPQGLGGEFSQLSDLIGITINDLFVFGAEAYFSIDGSIAVADWSVQNSQWELRTSALLSENGINLSSPKIVNNGEELTLVVKANDGERDWIAEANQDAGGNWRLGPSLLESNEDENFGHFSIVEEFGLNQWRIYAAVNDSLGSTIRQWHSQDWENWNQGLGISHETLDVGAPTVSEEADRFRMWYSIGQDGIWDIAYAESIDGEHWEDFGIIADIDVSSEQPPVIGIQATPISGFHLQGSAAGYQGFVEVGETAVLDSYGWALTAIAGQWLDTDLFGAFSSGGIHITDQWNTWTILEIVDGSGVHRIAYLDEIGNQEILVEPTDDITSVESAILVEDDDGLHLIYSEVRGNQSIIVERFSENGLEWSETTTLLEPSEGWDSLLIEPSDRVEIDGIPTLIYAGTDGGSWAVGAAQLTDGSWTGSEEPWFDLGRPGNWDDSGVRHAKIQSVNDGWYLWHSGFDGTSWRIGSAYSPSALSLTMEWDRMENSTIDTGWFHPNGATNPLPFEEENQWYLYYGGIENGVTRVGHAIGSEHNAMRIVYRYPTLGDYIEFETVKGDEERVTIPLESSVVDTSTFGIGLTDISVDSERGFLYASSKLMPHISVIDIRDDSQGDFVDRNYLDEEAKIILPTSLGSAGFRQVIPHPDGKHLLAISDSPEAVFIIDVSELEDNAENDRIYDVQSSWLNTPIGGESDAGERTRTSMGPGQMLLDHNHHRLFVSNFNANSISVFDLTIGTGIQIAELPTQGENPYAMTLSPDGVYLVVANYTGDVVDNVSHSTLSIFDVNPLSETVFEMRTQVVNR